MPPSTSAPRSAPDPLFDDTRAAHAVAFGRRLVLAAVLILAAAFAWRMETARDFGIHVASGRWILAHHQWPHIDSFTYSVAGHPYIDMHGLFQVVLAWVARGGMVAVGGFRVALVLATTLLMWRGARGRGVASPLLLGAGFVLGLIAWELRFLMRPELATYLLLALQLELLRRHASTHASRWLLLCIPLQLVWVYTHTFSLFGIAILGLYALADVVQRWRSRDFDRMPWLTLAGAIAVLFLNPYGVRGIAFLWELRTRLEAGNVFGESLQELTSPFAPQAVMTMSVRAFLLLVVAAVIGLASRVRRWPVFELGLTVMMAALALTRLRNLGLFVVAVLPIVLHAMSETGRSIRTRFAFPRPGLAGAGLAVVLLLFTTVQVVRGGYYEANSRSTRFGHVESAGVFPIATLERLERDRLADPLFNTIDFGGYLLAHRDTTHRVFIDGRLEVMGDGFYREYDGAVSGDGWNAVAAHWAPRTALVSRSARRLIQAIRADSAGWALIDVDGAAILFARRIPEHAAAIAAADARLATIDHPIAATEDVFLPEQVRPGPSLLRPVGFPFERWGRGGAFLSLGMAFAARNEYRAAIEQAGWPEPSLVRSLVGTDYLLGRDDEARIWIQQFRRNHGRDEGIEKIARELGLP